MCAQRTTRAFTFLSLGGSLAMAVRYLPADLDAIEMAAQEARIQEELERRRRLKAEVEAQVGPPCSALGRVWPHALIPHPTVATPSSSCGNLRPFAVSSDCCDY